MEGISFDIFLLAIYWIIFWNKFLENPYLLCTSEIASTYFPFWRWLKGRIIFKSDIYYPYPACIPFLSSFYPPQIISSFLSKFLSIDNAFRLYTYFILGHYFIASLIAYKVFGLFGAITLTYAGYCIKPQTPSFVYVITWLPGALLGGWFGAFCLGMAVLGGYWPILVYVLPLICVLKPFSLLGLVMALPQIACFLWYWPKSVRSKAKVDRNFGKLPWWKLIDLVWPSKSVGLVNGVHYPEAEMYMGIAVLFILHWSWWWIPLIISLLVCVGLFPQAQRIPTRSLYLLTLSVSFLSNSSISQQFLVFALQSMLLLRNSSIYPSFPFSQWWDKPSRLYKKYASDIWPNFTGYLENKHVKFYEGGFSLK